jgi:hypothetical protein
VSVKLLYYLIICAGVVSVVIKDKELAKEAKEKEEVKK